MCSLFGPLPVSPLPGRSFFCSKSDTKSECFLTTANSPVRAHYCSTSTRPPRGLISVFSSPSADFVTTRLHPFNSFFALPARANLPSYFNVFSPPKLHPCLFFFDFSNFAFSNFFIFYLIPPLPTLHLSPRPVWRKIRSALEMNWPNARHPAVVCTWHFYLHTLFFVCLWVQILLRRHMAYFLQ